MESLQGIIALTHENGMGLRLLRFPHRPVKYAAQRFVYIEILCPRIPFPDMPFVPSGAPRDIASQADNLSFRLPPRRKFLLLLPQIIPSKPIPQRYGSDYLLRQIGIISLCDQGAQPLHPHQQPLLLWENSAHGQGMGIFRPKTVYDIRLYYINDFFQGKFQRFIINFRPAQILPESVAG